MRVSQYSTLVMALLMVTSVMVGFPAGAVAQDTDGQIEITIDGDVQAGDTVTLTGTLNGSAVGGAEVFVNGDKVGTTNSDGQIDVTVPDTSEMGIAMETGSAFGERQVAVDGASDDGTDNETGNVSEIAIDIQGSVEAGNSVTVTGTLDGSPVGGADVFVNGDKVGTTDSGGQLEVRVPDAPEMVVAMEGDSAFGRWNGTVEGGDDGTENETERPENVTEIDIKAEGEVAAGNTVTLVGTADGAPVAGANVSVNGEQVGTTDDDGRINVTVPEAPAMVVSMFTGSAFGEFRERLDGGEFRDNRTDGPDNRTRGPTSGDGEVQEIDIDIEGDVQPGNTVTLVGTVDGSPAADARVTINGEQVGTTDGEGRIDVTVPDSKGMIVLMRGQTGLGYRIVSLTGDDTDPSEIQIEIRGDDDSEGEETEDGDGETDGDDNETEFDGDDNETEFDGDEDDEFDGDEDDEFDENETEFDGDENETEFDGDDNETEFDGDDNETEFDGDENKTDSGGDGDGETEDGDGEVESGDELQPGESVTLVGTIDGAPAAGVNVTVNNRVVGTTDAEGRIDVTVPDASEMSVRMFNLTAYGELTASVGGADSGGDGGSTTTIEVRNASVTHVGGPEPDAMPAVDAFVAGGMVQVQLVVPQSELDSATASRQDLSSIGVTTDTQFRIEVTTSEFQPRFLIGSGSGVDWEFTAGSNTTTLTITTSPVDQQYIFGPDRNPTIANWPSGEADQATVHWEAATSFAVDRLSGRGQDALQGGYVSTDAQAFDTPEFTPPGPGRESQLSVDIAGPHLTVDGEVNDGFYRAKLPDALLETWNVSNASQLRVAYKGDSRNFTATDVSGGVLIELDVTYSAGTVTIEPPTDGNATGTGDNETGAGNGTLGPAGAPPSNLAAFADTTRPGSVTPRNLGGKIRVESGVAADTSIELVRDSATNYTLEITAPESASNVTFFLQEQAVSASQDIEDLGMYLDGERQDFYVDESAGPGRSPWLAFQVPHFSTRTVTFTNGTTSDTGSTLSGVSATYDSDGNGVISITELGAAAAAYSQGKLSLDELSAVAATYVTT